MSSLFDNIQAAHKSLLLGNYNETRSHLEKLLISLRCAICKNEFKDEEKRMVYSDALAHLRCYERYGSRIAYIKGIKRELPGVENVD